MEALPIIIFVLVAFVVIVFAIFGAKAANDRKQELQTWAQARGWRFDDDGDRTEAFRESSIFRQGHSQRAYNTIRGALEIAGRQYQMVCGDFWFESTHGSGKNRRTVQSCFSYVVIRVPGEDVPDLMIRREGFFDRIVQAIGFEDIDFESEEFSRAYCVTSSSKKFAYDVVSPQMMEYLMREKPESISLARGLLCSADCWSTWDVAAFERAMRQGEQFFGLWPEYVLQDLRA